MKRVCFTDASVSLIQTGVDRFTVTYGKQVRKDLDYGRAAKELGECLMHQLACDDRLDNRTKAEAGAEVRRAGKPLLESAVKPAPYPEAAKELARKAGVRLEEQ